MSWQSSLLLLLAVACTPLAPSGGREPQPTVDVTTPEPEVSAPPPEIPLDEGSRGPLIVAVTVAARDGTFAAAVMPQLARHCAISGCHATPETIDLRSFPFAAEGSYAMDDIRARLGDGGDPHEVQRQLVTVLIDSMVTQYMPPAPTPTLESQEIEPFRAWLDEDLRTGPQPFDGRILVTTDGSSNEATCALEGAITDGAFRGVIDRSSCHKVLRARYEIRDAQDQVIATGELDGAAFAARDLWTIEASPLEDGN